MSPCLDDLVRDPARAGLLSSEERQALLAQAASLLVVLASSGVTGDRLLTVKDAAHKLGCAEHTFTVRKPGSTAGCSTTCAGQPPATWIAPGSPGTSPCRSLATRPRRCTGATASSASRTSAPRWSRRRPTSTLRAAKGVARRSARAFGLT